MEKRVIPALDWVVFPCVGPSPHTLIGVYQQIFSEWIPGLKDYEMDGKYFMEYYDDETKYPKGYGDENYYVEIWFSIRPKSKK